MFFKTFLYIYIYGGQKFYFGTGLCIFIANCGTSTIIIITVVTVNMLVTALMFLRLLRSLECGRGMLIDYRLMV